MRLIGIGGDALSGQAFTHQCRDAIDYGVVHEAARDVHGAVRPTLEDSQLWRVGATANGQPGPAPKTGARSPPYLGGGRAEPKREGGQARQRQWLWSRLPKARTAGAARLMRTDQRGHVTKGVCARRGA